MNLTAAKNDSICTLTPLKFITVKFGMIGVIGTTVSAMGIFLNIWLFRILRKPIFLKKINLFFVRILALLDIALCLEYILLFAVEAAYQYLQCYPLYRIWYLYIKPVFFLSKVTQLTSTYVIVLATVERFLALFRTQAYSRCCVPVKAHIYVVALVAVAVALKMVTFWELSVREIPACAGTLKHFYFRMAPFASTYGYSYVLNLWIDKSLQIFCPLLLVSVLNGTIIYRVRKTIGNRALIRLLGLSEKAEEKRQSLKTTTKAFAAVVMGFILGSTLGFCLSLTESIDMEFLRRHRVFYSFCRDTINLLTIITSVSRFFIHFICNPKIRAEVKSALFKREGHQEYMLDENHN